MSQTGDNDPGSRPSQAFYTDFQLPPAINLFFPSHLIFGSFPYDKLMYVF